VHGRHQTAFLGNANKQQLVTAGQSSSSGSAVQDTSEAAERAAVDYLTNHVFTSRPQRHPVTDAILPRLKATNKTVQQYRSSVAAYLNSELSEFKQRWDALKAQVSLWLARCKHQAPQAACSSLIKQRRNPIAPHIKQAYSICVRCHFNLFWGSRLTCACVTAGFPIADYA